MPIIVVEGPPYGNYSGPVHLPGTIQYPFPNTQWVCNGLCHAILRAAGPGGFAEEASALSATYSIGVWDVFRGLRFREPFSFLLPTGFALATDVRDFFDKHSSLGVFPSASLSFWEGNVESPDAVGLYLDPIEGPHSGEFYPTGLSLQNNNWIYWPQSNFQKVVTK